jgi:MFS family permease
VLLIVNGCYGLLWGIFWPAFTGIMPTIVPKEGLQKANAISALMTNSGLILGAASAGFLIDAYGAAITLGIDAATFLLSGVMVYSLRHLTPRIKDSKNTMIDDLVHGWKVFISFKWIVIVVIAFSFIVMCWAAAENCNYRRVNWVVCGCNNCYEDKIKVSNKIFTDLNNYRNFLHTLFS